MDKLITLPLLQQYDELIKNKIETTVGNYLSLDGGTVNGMVTIDNQLMVNGNIQMTADASTASSRAIVASSPSGQVVLQPTGRMMIYGNSTGKTGTGITIQSTPTSGAGSSLKVFDSGIMSAANDPNKVFASDGSLMEINEYPEITDVKGTTVFNNLLIGSWTGSQACTDITSVLNSMYIRFLYQTTNYYKLVFATSATSTGGIGASYCDYQACLMDSMTIGDRYRLNNRWSNFDLIITPGCKFSIKSYKFLSLGEGLVKRIV